MRRGVGIGAVQQRQQAKAKFEEKGKELTEANLSHVKESMDVFRTHLEEFARKHKKQINQDPEFRRQFQIMCAKIGVDPLASTKGFWADILGIGTFYFELSVQIVHATIATRQANGGLMDIQDLVTYLRKIRAKRKGDTVVVSEDDVKRAIAKLEILGNGIKIVPVGNRQLLVSVPVELSSDQTALLAMAETSGMVTLTSIRNQLKWPTERSERAIQLLEREGMIWIDIQHESGEKAYYFPSLYMKST